MIFMSNYMRRGDYLLRAHNKAPELDVPRSTLCWSLSWTYFTVIWWFVLWSAHTHWDDLISRSEAVYIHYYIYRTWLIVGTQIFVRRLTLNLSTWSIRQQLIRITSSLVHNSEPENFESKNIFRTIGNKTWLT